MAQTRDKPPSRAVLRVAPGSLAQVCGRIARHYRISVAFADPKMARLQSPGVALASEPEDALAQALSRLPLRLVKIDGRSFRVLAAKSPPPISVPPSRPARLSTPPPPKPAPAPQDAPPIVVTGSKRDAALATYPASVRVLAGAMFARTAGAGTQAIAAQTSALATTGLGAGREKIFLRGVGDSSFTGDTPATVGLYLDEARLNYATPDPGLLPVDLERVEILAGPQGTLSGSGSLGGVVRLVAAPPELGANSAWVGAGLVARTDGGIGSEASVVTNLALDERAAARLVAYRFEEPGYIDNPVRGERDIDRLVVTGARAALVRAIENNWTLRLTAAGQRTRADDRDYVDATLGRARGNRLAEPYDNSLLLLSAAVSRSGEALSDSQTLAVSLTRQTGHDTTETRDGFEPDGGIVERSGLARSLSAEYRVSGAGFVVGASVLASQASRTITCSAEACGPTRTKTGASEAALFGEYSHALGAALVSLGMRAGYYASTSEATGEGSGVRGSKASAVRFLPSVGASIDGGDFVPWVRYAASFRPPIAPTLSVSDVGLRGDTIHSLELGLRRGGENSRVRGGANVAFARWYDVQAEVVDTSGRPLTANAGDATILTAEADLAWQADPSLSLGLSATANMTRLKNRALSTIIVVESQLPNVPAISALATAEWQSALGRHPLSIGARARYVGHSISGVGPALRRDQGNYGLIDFHADLDLSPWTISLRVDNALDGRGRRFGLGSIGFLDREETFVAIKPRTFAMTVSAEF